MLYVYRRAASQGARALAEALEGVRYRALQRPLAERVRPGDVVVCWGEQFPTVPGVTVLNGHPIQGKFEDAIQMRQAGVPTVTVSRTMPEPIQGTAPPDPAQAAFDRAKEMAEEFVNLDTFTRSPVLTAGVSEFQLALGQLVTTLRVPAPATPPRVAEEGWLPRQADHVGGNDLLHPPATADYWSRKEPLVREFRIHSFNGVSIRAGVKAPREGYPNLHAWIRSWDGGWRIRYDGVSSKQPHRDLAHRAVTALGLQFGAVDIGEKADGSLIVLEVNRAPGLDGGTIEVYAQAIERWLENRA